MAQNLCTTWFPRGGGVASRYLIYRSLRRIEINTSSNTCVPCYAKKYKNHIRVVKKKRNEGGKNMIAKLTKHKTAFTLSEGGQSPFSNLGQCRGAFTLAEVLITLSVIGVVAALTIPGMIQNHNEKAWMTAKDLWDKKLVEATRQMNIDGVMTGVANSTEDYMNYFKKYVKVIKTCENDKLSNCYAPKIVQTAEEDVEVDKLKTSNNLGHRDWNTNTMGFVIADGTTVVMAYNPNCSSVDPFSAEGQNGQVGCMSMLIDVNGKKGPNRVGDDIQLKNATISTCDMKLGDLCMAASDIYPTTAINTCTGSGNEEWDDDRGSTNSYCATNHWAGVKKACADNDMRLPTLQELADVATYIYKQEDNPIGAYEGERFDITFDATRAAELNWSTWRYWSSEPYGSDNAYQRSFVSIYSSRYGTNVGFSNYRARCFK